MVHIFKDLLIIFVICALGTGLTEPQLTTSYILATAVGQLIAVVGICFLFFRIRTLFTKIIPKPKFSDKLLKYCTIYLCLIFGWEAYNKYSNEVEYQRAVDEANANIGKYVRESFNENDGFLQNTTLEFKEGNSDKINNIIKKLLNEMINHNNEYESAISELRLERLFDAEWISSAANLRVAKTLVAESAVLTNEFYTKHKLMRNSDYAYSWLNMQDIALNKNEKEDFVRGWEKGVKKHIELSQLMEDSSSTHCSKLVEFVSFLEENRQDWTVEEGVFAFESQENLDKFNSIVDEIILIERMQSKLSLDFRENYVE